MSVVKKSIKINETSKLIREDFQCIREDIKKIEEETNRLSYLLESAYKLEKEVTQWRLNTLLETQKLFMQN